MNCIKNNNILTISTSEESYITLEFLSNNTIHIYKDKESTKLVKLNEKKFRGNIEVKENEENVLVLFNEYVIFVDSQLHIDIYDRFKNALLRDYREDSEIRTNERDFSLAALEGHKKELKIINFKTQINIQLPPKSYVYGLGDKTSFLNKIGYTYISYNTDDPSPHNETYKSLYKSINFLILNTNYTNYVGLYYPSTYKTEFNIGKYKSDLLYIASTKGSYDYFVFLGNVKDIISSYSSLVGNPILPQLKMLGNQQSRWSYANKEEVEEVINNYEKHNLPLDYIHLDIDYMDNYKVFTVDKNKFPNFKDFVKETAKKDISFVTIIDPAVKLEDNYFVYENLKEKGFAKLNGTNYVNVVWPGDSVYPNYFSKEVSNYFGLLTKDFLDFGIGGIWADMNEPASFKGPLPDNVEFKIGNKIHYHDEIHNIYGDYMVKSLAKGFIAKNLRPYLITRAAFATTSSLSTVWNGDNTSLWSHLEFSIPQILTMNICGFPFDGVDIGGFNGDCTKELLIRWIEANIFSLLLRNHSALNTRQQEPYAYDNETIEIYRSFLNLRYSFIPYLYDLSFVAHFTGSVPLRPLFYSYPEDIKVKEINDEFMIGDSLLYAPILHQGATQRIVYLPKGKWINYFTNESFIGERYYICNAKINESILFVKNGSIIPQYVNLQHINKSKIDTLRLYVTPGNGRCYNYEDDGVSLDANIGKFNKYLISHKGKKLIFKTIKQNYETNYKNIEIIYNSKVIKIPFSFNFTAELH